MRMGLAEWALIGGAAYIAYRLWAGGNGTQEALVTGAAQTGAAKPLFWYLGWLGEGMTPEQEAVQNNGESTAERLQNEFESGNWGASL